MQSFGGVLSALALAAAGWLAMALSAPADATTYTLQGVTFESGEPGTATGHFTLDVYGYGANGGTDVTTTSTGTWPGPLLYTGLGLVGAPPASSFVLQSPGSPWGLVLDFPEALADALTSTIALVPGGGGPGSYTGSYEICGYSSLLCDGVPGGSARLITAGDVLAPEPGSLVLVATALAALGVVCRRSAIRAAEVG